MCRKTELGMLCAFHEELSYLHSKNATDSDCTPNAIQAQGCNLLVITVLQIHTERCQEWTPSYLQRTNYVIITTNGHSHGTKMAIKKLHS